jgi:polysaccharide export outer membrane protein
MWASLLMAFLLSTGCETTDNGSTATNSGGKTAAEPSTNTSSTASQADWIDRVQIGDMIVVNISEVPNPPPPFQLQVRTDGKINLLHNYEFNVAGKKRQEIEKEIENFYVREKEIYKRLTVSVALPPRLFNIGGEVRQQGQLMHPGQMTVIKAIHAAGGFTDFANRRKIVVTRASDKTQITVDYKKAIRDPKADIFIYPGDLIFVDKTAF